MVGEECYQLLLRPQDCNCPSLWPVHSLVWRGSTIASLTAQCVSVMVGRGRGSLPIGYMEWMRQACSGMLLRGRVTKVQPYDVRE